jgi:hypothetical protein
MHNANQEWPPITSFPDNGETDGLQNVRLLLWIVKKNRPTLYYHLYFPWKLQSCWSNFTVPSVHKLFFCLTQRPRNPAKHCFLKLITSSRHEGRWWRQYAPLKHQYATTRLHGATSQKTLHFISLPREPKISCSFVIFNSTFSEMKAVNTCGTYTGRSRQDRNQFSFEDFGVNKINKLL